MIKLNYEARARTVEKIWTITENLNILYRENWTKLADREIAQFQDQLVKRIMEDMMATQNAGTYTGSSTSETVTERRGVSDYEWNFPKAFLYSLTVLTTIGEFQIAINQLYSTSRPPTVFSASNERQTAN